MKKMIHFILFQSLWFAVILGASYNNYIAAWMLLALTAVMSLQEPKSTDVKHLVFFTLVGFIADSVIAINGWVNYQSYAFPSQLAPLWIVILWMGFALQLNRALSWMLEKHVFGYLFMMLGGPLSYFAAEKLGAITIQNPYYMSAFLSLSWGAMYFYILRPKTSYKEKDYAY